MRSAGTPGKIMLFMLPTRCSAGTKKRMFCNDLKVPGYTNAAVAPLANSRRVNHFAAGVFLGLGHLFAGLRALVETHKDGINVLYFMRFNE